MSSPRHIGRGPLVVTLLAVAFWLVVIVLVGRWKFAGDVRGMLFLGREIAHPAVFQAVPRCGRYGYDGQFYATLATDPLLSSAATVKGLDDPGYRAGRIGLPLAAWLLALTSPAGAVVAYQLLCWGLAVAGVGAVAVMARQRGAPSWPAVLLVTSGGLVTSMLRSTPDAAATGLLLTGLGLLQARRERAAIAILAFAVLSRETALIACLTLAAFEARRKAFAPAVRLALLPALPLLAWKLWLGVARGMGGMPWRNVFSLPSTWAPERLGQMAPARLGLYSTEMWGTLAIAATLVAALAVLAREDKGPLAWVFLAFTGFSLLLGPNIYGEAYAYSRVLLPIPFLAVVLAGEDSRRWRHWVVLAPVILYAIVGAVLVRSELLPFIR